MLVPSSIWTSCLIRLCSDARPATDTGVTGVIGARVYLYEHTETKSLLEAWANNMPLTLGSFFFYALGSPEQKSQEGLIRALLYQILDADPSLIPILFPSMWQEAQISDDIKITLPSSSETVRADPSTPPVRGRQARRLDDEGPRSRRLLSCSISTA